MRGSGWFPTSDLVAAWHAGESADDPHGRPIKSYVDLPMRYLDDMIDHKEFAMWNQDVVLRPETYGPWMSSGFLGFRDDLGGREAFVRGVEAAKRVGRFVAMYVAGYGIRKNAPMFDDRNYRDFAIVDSAGEIVTGGYEEGFFCCHGYTPWQDNIVQICRMLAETGIDEIRLDELGMPFKPCFNPAHRHEDPYDCVAWSLELVRRVREAIEEINPDMVLSTEFYTDAYHAYTNAALVMGYPGTGIDVMRVALPTYLAVSYHAGAADAAISGAIPTRPTALRHEWPWVTLPHAAKPEGHPGNEGRALRWHELAASFTDAVFYGLPIEVDPVAQSDRAWKGHLWLGGGYCLLVGGYDDGSSITADGLEVLIPELPFPVDNAWEIDAETLETRGAAVRGVAGSTYLSLHHDLSAVLFAGPEAPAFVVPTELPATVPRGEKVHVEFSVVEGTSKSGKRWAGTFYSPGILEKPIELTIPGEAVLTIPMDTEPGWYYYRVDGETFPMKRWFRVVS